MVSKLDGGKMLMLGHGGEAFAEHALELASLYRDQGSELPRKLSLMGCGEARTLSQLVKAVGWTSASFGFHRQGHAR